jgi:hypothetical protein
LRSFEQQTADTIRTLVVWCAVLSAAFVIALGLSIYGLLRLSNDEARTCQIQARGLPAGHDLQAAMVDIYALLTIPPSTKAQRLAAAQEPAHVKAIVNALTAHLAEYKAAEATQPHGRIC